MKPSYIGSSEKVVGVSQYLAGHDSKQNSLWDKVVRFPHILAAVCSVTLLWNGGNGLKYKGRYGGYRKDVGTQSSPLSEQTAK